MGLDGASIGFNLVVALDIDAVRNLEIVTANVGGRITAEAVKIGRNVVLMGLEVGTHCVDDATKENTEAQGVNFVGAEINGELTLYREASIDDILDSLNDDRENKQISNEAKEAARKEALKTRTVISGNLRLARTRVLGGVVLDGAQIEGTLDFEDAELRANLRCRPIYLGPIGQRSSEIVRTSVYGARFAMVKIDGDMDLTGLNVKYTPDLRGSGDLNLRNSTIQGRLEFYPHSRTEDVKPVDSTDEKTVIDRRLWLDGANIGYMIISGESFTKLAPDEQRDEPRRRPSIVTRLLWWAGRDIHATPSAF